MATLYPMSIDDLKKIIGVGDSKARKFGKPFLELIETGPLRNAPESCNEGGRRNEVAREGRWKGWGGFFGTKSEVGTAQKEDRKQPDRCTSATGCLEVENGCRHLAENFGFHGRDFRRKE